MNLEIWGAEESWLENYMNSRTLIRLSFKSSEGASQNDIKAFFKSQNKEDGPPSILKINGDRASIQINGYLSPDGPDFYDRLFGYGGTSYNEIIKSSRELRGNAVIKDVDLLMDTPGGLVKGLDNVWKELMLLRKEKNLAAINYGMLASAGYYLASAADKINSTSEANEQGSIGVMVAGTDWSKYDEKMGIKDVVIVSKNAPDKYIDIATDKGKNILRERVDTFERFFLDRISAGRGLTIDYIKKNFGRGGMLVSKNPVEGEADALSVKMIDKVIGISTETGDDSSVSINEKQEEKNMAMTFSEFLAANPEVKAEMDRQLETKYQSGLTEGKKAGKEEIEGRIKAAFNFMGEKSVYPDDIKMLSIEVARGEKPLATLQTVVHMHDQKVEKEKSEAAKTESEAAGNTPGQQNPPKSEDGVVKNEEDMKAAQAETKKFF